MKEKEFNLSEKLYESQIIIEGKPVEFVDEEDIKEFIKRTEEDMRNPKLSRIGMIERFKIRAGEKLI